MIEYLDAIIAIGCVGAALLCFGVAIEAGAGHTMWALTYIGLGAAFGILAAGLGQMALYRRRSY